MYSWIGKTNNTSKWKYIKVCKPNSEVARSELVTEVLKLRQKISKKYKVCWQCFKSTTNPGGYEDAACKKLLFYECSKCEK